MSNEISIENKNTDKKKFDIFDFMYKYGTLITILLLIIFFQIVGRKFLDLSNVLNILRSISIVTIIAIGVTVSLTVGGFDLSVGSTASLSGAVVMAMFIWHNQVSAASIIVAILASLVVGVINSIMIVKVKIPDMLMTLATMFVFQGVALTYTKGAAISQNMVMSDGNFAKGHLTRFFTTLGQLPWIIIAMIIVVLIVHLFLNKTKQGRYMYIIGGNMEAARLSGIQVNKYRVYAYLISSFLAGIGGIILAARVQTAEVNAGSPYLMDAVAATFIGFSVGGSGKPNAIGTFVGSVLIGILQNGLVMMSVPYYAMDIVKGVVLAFALALTYYKKK